MLQVGSGLFRILGLVVPLPQPEGGLEERALLEGGNFVGMHFAALQLEALCRGWRKLLEVFGMDGALVALGVHVQPDGLGDLGAEVTGQPFFANALVAAVDALFGDILGQSMQEMPDVVQQRRRSPACRAPRPVQPTGRPGVRVAVP